MVDDCETVAFSLFYKFLRSGKYKSTQIFWRYHQTALTSEVVTDENSIQFALHRFIEYLVGFEIEVYNSVYYSLKHFWCGVHRYERIFHAEGGTCVLKVCRPHDAHFCVIVGYRSDSASGLFHVDMFLGIGP